MRTQTSRVESWIWGRLDVEQRVDPLQAAAQAVCDRRSGQPVAQISRQWFSIRDAYGVAVAPEVDQALMLAAAVCIDEISERERERNR